MRSWLLISFLVLAANVLLAETNAYRLYLLSQMENGHLPVRTSQVLLQNNEQAFIPHYEIPKGNVFCRMEDKLTRATKVWIKVGVK